MMPEVDEYSASLVSRMASLPATHEEMVKTHAVSHMMQDLARGSPRVQEAAVRGLASIASTQRRNGISVPGSPMKVSVPEGNFQDCLQADAFPEKERIMHFAASKMQCCLLLLLVYLPDLLISNFTLLDISLFVKWKRQYAAQFFPHSQGPFRQGEQKSGPESSPESQLEVMRREPQTRRAPSSGPLSRGATPPKC